MKNKIPSIQYLRRLYKSGYNIEEYLRMRFNKNKNTIKIIRMSYEARSGCDMDFMKDNKWKKFQENYTKEIAGIIMGLCYPEYILEAGVGEGITLCGVLQELKSRTNYQIARLRGYDINAFGFDISSKRLEIAKRWLIKNNVNNVILKNGNLLHIPFNSNYMDVVYTSHAIEPNGGKEIPILKELYRVARKYILLFEPGYEFSDDDAKNRMDRLKYCKGIKETAISLGYNVIKHEPFKYTARKENPTVLTIIKKDNGL